MPVTEETTGAPFTVQAAAFKTRAQADALREKLGSDAYVVEVSAESGVRYRVRMGAFRTKEDADAAAARIRAEHALSVFVTTR